MSCRVRGVPEAAAPRESATKSLFIAFWRGHRPAVSLSPEIAAAALARNDRYVSEVVEALNVCPYARPSRLDGRTARFVLDVDADGQLEVTDAHLSVLADMDQEGGLEVVQWIYPTARFTATAWDRAGKAFTSACHEAHGESVVGVAPLHPEAPYLSATAAAMVPLFRRAPDPTLQWISLRSIDAVRATRPRGEVLAPSDPQAIERLLESLARPSLAETIAERNRRTALRIGLRQFEDLMAGLRD